MQVSDILQEGDSPISSATDCPVSIKHPCYAQLSYLKARVSSSLRHYALLRQKREYAGENRLEEVSMVGWKPRGGMQIRI